MENAKERLAQAVKEAEEIVYSYLPAEEGHQKTIFEAMNYTYILKCKDETLYTGWTNDIEKRLEAHNAGKGAKYTRSRRPVELVYLEQFETKEEAMEEKRVTDVVCTKCRRMLRKKIRWFSSGQRYYLCLATCPEHGMMKGKIRMKKSEDGRVFAVKTVKPVDEEGAEAVFLKKEEARIRRAEKSRQKKLHGVE